MPQTTNMYDPRSNFQRGRITNRGAGRNTKFLDDMLSRVSLIEELERRGVTTNASARHTITDIRFVSWTEIDSSDNKEYEHRLYYDTNREWLVHWSNRSVMTPNGTPSEYYKFLVLPREAIDLFVSAAKVGELDGANEEDPPPDEPVIT